jgi:sec-independent protein translocase protein TatC
MMIRTFLLRLWWVLTTPFRWIAKPFRAIRAFIFYEPEDTPVTDVFSRTIENPSVLIEHIEALRRHLFRALIALVITVGISTVFAARILDWLAQPVGGIDALRAIEVTESIGAFMRVSLMGGFVLALPYIGFELFAFIHPGLQPRERVLFLITIPIATLLFVLGAAFAFKIMLPVALPFLLEFLGIVTTPRPANYIRFVTGVMFWVGMAFQFPLIMYALAAVGIIQARTLIVGWRFAILGIAVLAAMITPTVDPVNMALVMAPMIALYFIGIGLAALAQRGRERRSEQNLTADLR